MDKLQKYKSQVTAFAALLALLIAIIVIFVWYFASNELDDQLLVIFITVLSGIFSSILGGFILMRAVVKPLEKLSDVVSFAGHSRGDAPPKVEGSYIGSQLASSLASDIYDMTSASAPAKEMLDELPEEPTIATTALAAQNKSQSTAKELFDHSPLASLSMNARGEITFINQQAIDYFQIAGDVIDKPFFDVIQLQFAGDITLEKWMNDIRMKAAHATNTWPRVRCNNPQNELKQFELYVSYYAHADEAETQYIVVITDKSAQFNQLDSEISYLAMAVHELRTPLTVMKGYLEVLQDEAAPMLNQEMKEFITKTQVNAKQLTDFVGNILNIARVDENALVLKLQKDDWAVVLKEAVDELQLRAKVNGKQIELKTEENLPPVAIDRTSMREVLNNLVDNAIKYSGDSDRIIVSARLKPDKSIETSVQDFGRGIPENVAGELFQKFYRSHRTKQAVSGTGIGLYLCKALVNAHAGNIWVRSQEGSGSIFTFTIQSYETANIDNEGQPNIERSAHGWIKNHSLNRQ